MKRGKSWPRENRPMSSMDFSVRSGGLFSRRNKKQTEIPLRRIVGSASMRVSHSLFVAAALIDLPLGEVGSAQRRQVRGDYGTRRGSGTPRTTGGEMFVPRSTAAVGTRHTWSIPSHRKASPGSAIDRPIKPAR
jgi:hypothetical protein